MNRIVNAARSYLGCKFRHRGRTRNGLDCAGLVIVAYRDCGVELHDFIHYGRDPSKDGLVSHAVQSLGRPVASGKITADELQVGDVILRRYEKDPHHVGIIADYPYGNAFALIHADGTNGKVVEHRLSDSVIADITHVFRRPV